MTIAVDLGRKATKPTNQLYNAMETTRIHHGMGIRHDSDVMDTVFHSGDGIKLSAGISALCAG